MHRKESQIPFCKFRAKQKKILHLTILFCIPFCSEKRVRGLIIDRKGCKLTKGPADDDRVAGVTDPKSE